MSRGGERAMVPPAEPRSYYGRPILKQPTWKHWIPAYFFAGGLSAGSALLALGGRLTGRKGLAQRSRLTALGAISAGAVFLIADLGRPSRFANMLRVAKPTSPMSVGSWVLAGYGPAVGGAAIAEQFGIFPRLAALADVSAAAMAPAVATYTGVLLADTAIPIWHEASVELPALFAAGAAASAGGWALLTSPASECEPARRLAVAGGVAELAAWRAMDKRLGDLAEPYRKDPKAKAAEAIAAAGVGLACTRRFRRLGGALLAAGAALTRFVVTEGGKASAADPKYVVGPQRARLTAEGYQRG